MNFNVEGKRYQAEIIGKQNDFICESLDKLNQFKYKTIIGEIKKVDDKKQESILLIITRLQQVFIASNKLKEIDILLESQDVEEGSQKTIQLPETIFYFESLITQIQSTLDSITKIIVSDISISKSKHMDNMYYSTLISNIRNKKKIDLSNNPELLNLIKSTLRTFKGIVHGSGFKGGSLRNQTIHKISINDLVYTEITINGYSKNEKILLDQYVNDFPLFNSSISISKAILNLCLEVIRSIFINTKNQNLITEKDLYSLEIDWSTNFIPWKKFISKDDTDDIFSINKFERGAITIREMVKLDKSVYEHCVNIKHKNNSTRSEVITEMSKDKIAVVKPC